MHATLPALQAAIEEPKEAVPDQELLEVEFVAIYW